MGSIGRAWTISFLRAGFDVSVWNRNGGAIDDALILIEGVLSELEDKGLLNGQHPHILMNRIQRCETLADAVKGAAYVQENVAERLDVKQMIFQQMDASAETYAILATSASGIVPSAFTERLRSRDRCIVAHPLNPPYLIPVVDIVPSPWTSQETIAKTIEIMKTCWQKPILMQHEDPGFITIRLQAMMYHECWRLVKSGLATPEDVDVAVREGLGLIPRLSDHDL
jgi:3-hydroxyacyl-CoA dehydrogenase